MRLHQLHPDELDAEQRALYDLLTADGRVAPRDDDDPGGVRMVDGEGRMEGPFNAWLTHPGIGWAVQETSRRLRFDGVLTLRIREIVILIVAAFERSDYEWGAHAPIARTLGITDAEIDAISTGTPVEFADPAEGAAASLARALVATGDADDATYERAQRDLGDPGVVEVSTTVGFYQLIAQQLRLFRVPAPAGPWPS
jgi:4-carboxymuconolactone decarboxylase